MKAWFFTLFFLMSLPIFAQNLSGQWTGGFVSSDDYYGRKTEYVVELEVDGSQVYGFSTTYFLISTPTGRKRCYVICKLEGKFDKASKSLYFTEIKKVKSNTPPPPEFNDCFQLHSLTYLKEGGRELLVGKWKSAKKEENCGSGSTSLERKSLASFKTTPPPPTSTPKKQEPPVTKAPPPPSKPTTKPPTQPSVPNTPKKEPATASIEKRNEPAEIQAPVTSKKIPASETRTKQIIKTIDLDSQSFTVDLYDNGEIDGDTVSVYFNGELLAAKKLLRAQPLTFKLKADPSKIQNELGMYPNTALMIVTVMDKRYEVRITSTEQTSGTVRFNWKTPE
jgi:hypothetical protein